MRVFEYITTDPNFVQDKLGEENRLSLFSKESCVVSLKVPDPMERDRNISVEVTFTLGPEGACIADVSTEFWKWPDQVLVIRNILNKEVY